MEYDIIHYPEKLRFELKQDGLTAFVQYRLVGNNLDIIHTIVPEPLEGQGIAGFRLCVRKSVETSGCLLLCSRLA